MSEYDDFETENSFSLSTPDQESADIVEHSYELIEQAYQLEEELELEKAQDLFEEVLKIRTDLFEEYETPDFRFLLAEIYDLMAGFFQRQSQPDLALEYEEKSLGQLKKLSRERGSYRDIWHMANVLIHQGHLFYGKQDFDQAADLYQEAIDLKEELLEERKTATDVQSLCDIYNALIQTYQVSGQGWKALQLLEKESELIEEYVFYSMDPDLDEIFFINQWLWTYKHLALLFQRDGDTEKAQEYFKKALEIENRVTDDNTFGLRELAWIYNDWGLLLESIGTDEEVEKAYIQSAKIKKNLYDREKIDLDGLNLLISQSNLGLLYRRMNEPEKAAEAFRLAVETAEEIPEGNDLYGFLMQAGDACWQLALLTGNLEEKIANLEKSLSYRQRLGELSDDPQILFRQIESANELAWCYRLAKENEKSIKLLGENLKRTNQLIRNTEVNYSKSNLIWIYNEMAFNYMDRGKNDLAKKWFYKVLELPEEILNDIEDEWICDQLFRTYNDLAISIQDEKEALDYLQKADQIKTHLMETRNRPSDLADYLLVHTNMAVKYRKLKRLKKAESLCLKNLELIDQIYSQQDNTHTLERLADTYDQLIYIYREKGDEKKLDEMYEKAVPLRLELFDRIQSSNASSAYVSILNEWADNLASRNKAEQSWSLYQKAIEHAKKQFEKSGDQFDLNDLLWITNQAAVWLNNTHQKDEGRSLFEENLSRMNLVLPTARNFYGHDQLVRSIKFLVPLYKKDGSDLESLYRKHLNLSRNLVDNRKNKSDRVEHIDLLCDLAFCLRRKNDEKQAESVLLTALKDAKDLRSEDRFAYNLNNLAWIHNQLAFVTREQELNDQAIQWFEQNLEIEKELLKNENDLWVRHQLFLTNNDLANLLDDSDRVLELYHKAEDLKKGLLTSRNLSSDLRDMVLINNNIACYFKRNKKQEPAKEYFKKNLEIFEQDPFDKDDLWVQDQVFKTYDNLSELAEFDKNPADYRSYLEKGIDTKKNIIEYRKDAGDYYSLADSLYRLAVSRKNKESKSLLEESLKAAQELNKLRGNKDDQMLLQKIQKRLKRGRFANLFSS